MAVDSNGPDGGYRSLDKRLIGSSHEPTQKCNFYSKLQCNLDPVFVLVCICHSCYIAVDPFFFFFWKICAEDSVQSEAATWAVKGHQSSPRGRHFITTVPRSPTQPEPGPLGIGSSLPFLTSSLKVNSFEISDKHQ